MCELFGLSSRLPTTVTVSMRLLARRGSRAMHLGDGWGVAFHAGDDALLIKQAEPADESAWVDFLETRQIRSRIVVSHIRHATQGEVSLRNTQPFARELGGRLHVFAHNGKLPGIEQRFASEFRRFRPIGNTDSEVAFCVLLERLAPLWDAYSPSPAERVDAVLPRFVAYFDSFVTKAGSLYLYARADFAVSQPDRWSSQPGIFAPESS